MAFLNGCYWTRTMGDALLGSKTAWFLWFTMDGEGGTSLDVTTGGVYAGYSIRPVAR